MIGQLQLSFTSRRPFCDMVSRSSGSAASFSTASVSASGSRESTTMPQGASLMSSRIPPMSEMITGTPQARESKNLVGVMFLNQSSRT